ncbi:MAG: SusC/RagA family TonB-linked outer membrane protein [Flavobacterium sp.]
MRSKFKWIFTLVLALSMQFSFAQDKTVTGTVTDGKLPLPGANVVIKGTAKGVSADMDGKFSINAKAGDVLVFSFSGFENKTITVGAANSYKVSLKESSRVLDDVLITGAVGIKKKRNEVTNAFTVISAKEMGEAANPNAVRSLSGKVAGLQINNVSNGVNGNTTIKLRTPLSFTTSGDALIVIDGVTSSASVLATMPTTMLESVNVIKGAQGAALYGELGVNGVIVVTTKRALKGDKVSVDFNSSVDFESISFVPKKQLKYGQGWSGAYDPIENGGWGELFDGSIRDVGLIQPDGSQLQAPYSAIKDNLKQFYKTGSIVQNGVSIRLGSDKAYLNFSADNQLREFVVKGDQYKRSNFLLKAGVNTDKWSVEGQFNYRVSKTNQSNAENTLMELQQGAANIPIGLFDNGGGESGWTIYYNNPFWVRDNNRLSQNTDYYNTAATVGFKVNKNVTLKYVGGINYSNSKQTSFSTQFAPLDADVIDVGSIGQISSFYQNVVSDRNYYSDLMANFDYKLTDNLNLKAVVGENMRKRDNNVISQGGQNLEIAGWYNISNVLNPDSAGQLRNSVNKTSGTAEFANVDLAFKDYLFFNLTGRYEHTSKLNIGKRDYFYPSAGVSFIPTKVVDMSKAKISDLKIYANFTKVGSTEAINQYDIIDYSQLGSGFPYSGTGNSFVNRYYQVNPDIKPEFYTTTEAGFVLGAFNNRVTLDAAVYMTDTKDAISNLSTSSASGILGYVDNVGKIRTKGMDVTLGLTPFKTDSFVWNSNITFSTYKNKVTELRGGQEVVTLYDVSNAAESSINGSIAAVLGESFPMLRGNDWLRDGQGRVIINATTGLPSANPEQQNLGKVTPDYTLGFTNNFTYKGFGLAFTMDYRKGGKIFSETIYNMTWSGHLEESADFDRDLGFVYPNSVINTGTSTVPVYTENTSVATAAGYGANGVITYYGSLAQLGSHNVVDATALKVREISLSYSLAPKYIKELGLTSLRFSVNARNPFIVLASNNKGYTDPEASSYLDYSTTNASRRASSSANTSGAASGFSQVSQYPSTRTFGFAVNVGF